MRSFRDIAVVISIAAFAHPAEVPRRYLHSLRLPQPISALVVRYVEWVIGYRFEAVAPQSTQASLQTGKADARLSARMRATTVHYLLLSPPTGAAGLDCGFNRWMQYPKLDDESQECCR
jgi:hypothetical protein